MRILITGGAGFIGAHTAFRFAADHDVSVVDNLSRAGSESNLQWLQSHRRFDFVRCDIRQPAAILQAVKAARPGVVVHLAAQVAVTTSVNDPRTDFDINALGTFNVLEAVRQAAPDAVVLFASTNKVYGGMEETGIVLRDGRYQYAD